MRIDNINVNKLHTEFNNAKIYPHPVLILENGDGDFTFPEGTDMALVQRIVDAHDLTPLPKPLSETEQIRIEMARANAEMFETMLSLMGGM